MVWRQTWTRIWESYNQSSTVGFPRPASFFRLGSGARRSGHSTTGIVHGRLDWFLDLSAISSSTGANAALMPQSPEHVHGWPTSSWAGLVHEPPAHPRLSQRYLNDVRETHDTVCVSRSIQWHPVYVYRRCTAVQDVVMVITVLKGNMHFRQLK